MNRDELLTEVEDLAQRIVGIGDLDAFYEVFGTRDVDFDLTLWSDEELQEVFDEFIQED